MDLYSVTHKTFATDDLVYTYTIVEASCPEAAIIMFNQYLEENPDKKAYPYYWGKAKSAEKVKILRFELTKGFKPTLVIE